LNITATLSNFNPTTDSPQTIYFEVLDVPDSSAYVSGTYDDNNDTSGNAGTFEESGTTTYQVATNSGVATATLDITRRYAGDNYKVIAYLKGKDDSIINLCGTGILTAWKRVYIEKDDMFKHGSTEINDIYIGTNVILVNDITPFNPGDTITIMDTFSEDYSYWEFHTISNVDKNNKIVFLQDSVSHTYYANADPVNPNCYLGVVTEDLLWESNITYFSDLIDFAFVEFVLSSSSSSPIPNPDWTEIPDSVDKRQLLDDYQFKWWGEEHKGKANCLHLIGGQQNPLGDGAYGFTYPEFASSFVWVEYIISQPDKDVNDTTIHELLHNFNRSPINGCDSFGICCHCNEFSDAILITGPNPSINDYCIMSPNYHSHDDVIGLCLNHLLTGENGMADYIDESIRNQIDPIGRYISK